MKQPYLQTLIELIEAQDIDEGASFVITATEGQPAVVQVQDGSLLRLYVESEDQRKLELKAEVQL